MIHPTIQGGYLREDSGERERILKHKKLTLHVICFPKHHLRHINYIRLNKEQRNNRRNEIPNNNNNNGLFLMLVDSGHSTQNVFHDYNLPILSILSRIRGVPPTTSALFLHNCHLEWRLEERSLEYLIAYNYLRD